MCLVVVLTDVDMEIVGTDIVEMVTLFVTAVERSVVVMLTGIHTGSYVLGSCSHLREVVPPSSMCR